MSEDRIMFGSEPFIEVARRCAAVVDKYGKHGKYTEKGIDEDAFDLVQDFVEALGLTTSTRIVDDRKEKP